MAHSQLGCFPPPPYLLSFHTLSRMLPCRGLNSCVSTHSFSVFLNLSNSQCSFLWFSDTKSVQNIYIQCWPNWSPGLPSGFHFNSWTLALRNTTNTAQLRCGPFIHLLPEISLYPFLESCHSLSPIWTSNMPGYFFLFFPFISVSPSFCRSLPKSLE